MLNITKSFRKCVFTSKGLFLSFHSVLFYILEMELLVCMIILCSDIIGIIKLICSVSGAFCIPISTVWFEFLHMV